ncbi:ABC transporter permease [Ancylobacter lacus]|uniref:ABC transporter permease n=1 Tax=Ancylobacter lacus TaxID=2579970 RepID=UPI001BCC66C7|nr:ABC transporter permease [Ancylobacter lacus]MBS7538243.1 ABC transporter permease [Ancylobacter lacus]
MSAPGPAARRARRLAAAGLAPLLLWQCLFFLVPVGILAVISVWSMENYRLTPDLTLANYTAALGNAAVWRSLLLSVRTALFVTVACGLLAYPIAYFIARKVGRRLRLVLLVAVVAPFWISIVMRIAAWRILLGEHGVINQFLVGTGLIEAPLGILLYSPLSTMIGLVYAYLPLYVLPLYAAIDRIEQSWIDAAKDLNAGPLRAFWEVTLPLSLPGLVVGAVFCFIFGLGEFVTPALLGGGKQLLLSQIIQDQFQRRQDWPGGAAIAMVLMAMVMGLLAVSMRWLRRASGERP